MDSPLLKTWMNLCNKDLPVPHVTDQLQQVMQGLVDEWAQNRNTPFPGDKDELAKVMAQAAMKAYWLWFEDNT